MPLSRSHNTTEWLLAEPFAHRGLHHAASGVIENSLSAFRAAVSGGFGIELDVQLSADGEAIVFHDDDLKRLVGLPHPVKSLPAADLTRRKLIGTDDTIPLLGDVLDLVGGRVPILVEIKSNFRDSGPLERAVARMLASYNGPFAVMSFDPESVAWFANHTPAFPRGFIASTRYPRETGWRLSTPIGHRAAAADVAPDFIAYDIRSLPNSFTRAARKADMPVLTWTVRSESDFEKARLHADNIIFERK